MGEQKASSPFNRGMKTTYSGLYVKRPGAGFSGQKAIVRTPSLSEVLGHVCLTMLAMDSPKKSFADLIGEKSDIVLAELIKQCYFMPCMLGCGNSGCREWHQVYDVCDMSQMYCHVSECELEPYAMQEDDPSPCVSGLEIEEHLKGLIAAIMADKVVAGACLSSNIKNPESPEYAAYYKGYAEALFEVIKYVRALKTPEITEDV